MSCVKTKAVYTIYKCCKNYYYKYKVPIVIERHNIDYRHSILSFDLSLMYDFNTVDFQQTARL